MGWEKTLITSFGRIGGGSSSSKPPKVTLRVVSRTNHCGTPSANIQSRLEQWCDETESVGVQLLVAPYSPIRLKYVIWCPRSRKLPTPPCLCRKGYPQPLWEMQEKMILKRPDHWKSACITRIHTGFNMSIEQAQTIRRPGIGGF